MKEIKLTQGKVALVDDEDYEDLIRYFWCACKGNGTFYAGSSGKSGYRLMHRHLLKPNKCQLIDHKDGNGLNNQKYNLRICNPSQNNMNQEIRSGSSKYKGVHFNTQNQRWISTIDNKYLGSFNTEKEAALEYNKNAVNLFGEFARINELCQ